MWVWVWCLAVGAWVIAERPAVRTHVSLMVNILDAAGVDRYAHNNKVSKVNNRVIMKGFREKNNEN